MEVEALLNKASAAKMPDTPSSSEASSELSFEAWTDLDSARIHKRTVSAPNIVSDPRDHPGFIFVQSGSAAMFPSRPHTPPLLVRSSPDASTDASTAASTTANGSSSSGAGPKCLYVEDCDTRSVPRKAISHIFGRNKLCTRQIPDEIWVHFCRKHYQRGRYRNTAEYARIQCELVVTQIGRIHRWSEKNKADGTPGVVKDWALCLRKREKDRLQMKERQTGPYNDEGNNDDAEDANDQSVVNGWNVPSWLRRMCREGYTTDEIEDIAKRILREVTDRTLRQIPDVEFLPNVSTGSSDGARQKPSVKRKTEDLAPHRRSQSESDLSSSGYSSSVTPGSNRLVPYQPTYQPAPYQQQATYQPPHPDDRSPTANKRRRRTENSVSYQQSLNYPSATHSMEALPLRSYENPTSHYQTNHADGFSFNNGMSRNHGGRPLQVNNHYGPGLHGGVFHEDTYPHSSLSYSYDASPSHGMSYNGSPHVPANSYNEGPLPVPGYQSLPSTSLSVPHDGLSVPTNAPSSHRKSLSEAARSQYQQAGAQPDRAPTQAYSGATALSLPPMTLWDFPQPRPSTNWSLPNSGLNSQLPILGSSARHSRHQSTPNTAPSNIPRSPAPMYTQAEARYRVGVGDYVYETSSASGYSISGQLTPAQSTPSQPALSRSPSVSTHSSGHRPYLPTGPAPREQEEYYRVTGDAGERRV